MDTFIINERGIGLIGSVMLQSGMTLRRVEGETTLEGPCEIVFGKLYIYPAPDGTPAKTIKPGDEAEVVSEQRNMDEVQRRKDAIVHRYSTWQEQMGENSRSFDPSNEGW